jgi:hypothetical protein
MRLWGAGGLSDKIIANQHFIFILLPNNRWRQHEIRQLMPDCNRSGENYLKTVG